MIGKFAIIPSEMLEGGVVSRKFAEIRSGPSGDFAIKGQLLTRGSRFYILSKSKQWLYIYMTKTKEQGWIHQKATEKSKITKGKKVSIATHLLPTIFTTKKTDKIYTVPQKIS